MKAVKQKKCKICREPFTPHYSSFQKTCGISCAKAEGKQIVEKERKKKDKSEIDALKEKHKDGPYYKAKLQDEVNFIARLIDKGTNCRSCNAPITQINPAHGGHFWSRGGYPNLRFLLMNIHQQAPCCNKHKGGNMGEYYDGLKEMYGSEVANHIRDELRALYPVIRLSLPELKEKLEIATQIRKELQKLNLEYPPAMRIALRKKYDERLGIYK